MKKLDRYKLNNKGVTLIELIVVILLMGIMATAVVVNIATIFGRNAGDAAQKLSNVLDKTRLEAMNRVDGKVFLRISKESSGDFYATVMYAGATEGSYTAGDSEKLGNSGLTVTAVTDEATGAGTEITGNSGNYCVDLYFDKSTGRFTQAKSGAYAGSDTEIKNITFSANRTAQVILVWETGRNYVIRE